MSMGSPRTVLPKEWARLLFTILHTKSHCNSETAFRMISKHFFWREMKIDIMTWYLPCRKCNLAQDKTPDGNWKIKLNEILSKTRELVSSVTRQEYKEPKDICSYHYKYGHKALKCKKIGPFGKLCRMSCDLKKKKEQA